MYRSDWQSNPTCLVLPKGVTFSFYGFNFFLINYVRLKKKSGRNQELVATYQVQTTINTAAVITENPDTKS